jgi:hypothetical protein
MLSMPVSFDDTRLIDKAGQDDKTNPGMKSTDPVVGPQAEQTFFADPAIDRLVGMVFALTAEVHVLRDRLGLLEDALKRKGVVDVAALDTMIPEGALEARIAKERTALVQHVLEGLPGRLASKS